MIIQNISAGQDALPVRPISNDVPAVVAHTSTQAPPQQPSPEQLKNAVASINQAMRLSNRSLEFSVDPNTKAPVVKLTDTETGALISQYPSKEVLAIAQSIDEYLSQHQTQPGLLLKQKA
jgi:flagellar protein FlaG